MSLYRIRVELITLGILVFLVNILIDTVNCDPDFDDYQQDEEERSSIRGLENRHLPRNIKYLVLIFI